MSFKICVPSWWRPLLRNRNVFNLLLLQYYKSKWLPILIDRNLFNCSIEHYCFIVNHNEPEFKLQLHEDEQFNIYFSSPRRTPWALLPSFGVCCLPIVCHLSVNLGGGWVMVFNVTFNNISVKSWWSVVLVKETGVPGENHWPLASHWKTLSHNVVSSTLHLSVSSNSQL